jgi:5'-deoxynucleotidase YfbR-like HD superfamily hydrolase
MKNPSVKLIQFMFETGMMSRLDHEGYKRFSGIRKTLTSHSWRTAVFAYIIAQMEGYNNPFEAAFGGLIHDLTEIRTHDHDWVAKRYSKTDHHLAISEQTEALGEIGSEIRRLWEEGESRSTVVGNIIKDADYLEQAFTAREMIEQGYANIAKQWIANCRSVLRTDSAIRLCEAMLTEDPNEWWIKICRTNESTEQNNPGK